MTRGSLLCLCYLDKVTVEMAGLCLVRRPTLRKLAPMEMGRFAEGLQRGNAIACNLRVI